MILEFPGQGKQIDYSKMCMATTQVLLGQIAELFHPEARITFIVHEPGKPETFTILSSADDIVEVRALIDRWLELRTKNEPQPPEAA